MNVPLTVGNILLQCVKNGSVVSGHAGLTRLVSKITVSELSDTLDWIKGGELVCSTGFVLVNNEALQRRWVVEMAEKGVAGIILKPERFLGKLPREMIDLSNQYGLPLITVPLEVTWPSIIEDVMDMMVKTQMNNLMYSYEIHHELTQLVLRSRPIEDILDKISTLSGNPVILEDKYFNTVGHAGPKDKRESVRYRMSPDVRARLRADLEKAGKLRKTHELKISLPESPDGENTQMVSPVIAGRHHFGWLTILILDDRNGPNLIKTVIEHGATVLALSLLSEYSLLHAQSQEKAHYLKMLSDEIPVTDRQFKKASRLLGIDLDSAMSVIAMDVTPDITYYSFNALQGIVELEDPNTTVFLDKSRVVIFFHTRYKHSRSKTLTGAKDMAEAIDANFQRTGYSCTVGISDMCQDQDSIKAAYTEAIQCLEKARKLGRRVVTYNDLKLEKLFALIPDRERLRDLSDKILGALIKYDDQNNSELLPTLKMYLGNKYNKAQTAKDLNIHLNTLTYRLSRIQDILEVDLDDIEVCTLLYIACQTAQ